MLVAAISHIICLLASGDQLPTTRAALPSPGSTTQLNHSCLGNRKREKRYHLVYQALPSFQEQGVLPAELFVQIAQSKRPETRTICPDNVDVIHSAVHHVSPGRASFPIGKVPRMTEAIEAIEVIDAVEVHLILHNTNQHKPTQTNTVSIHPIHPQPTVPGTYTLQEDQSHAVTWQGEMRLMH